MQHKGLKARPGLLAVIVIVLMFAIAYLARHMAIITSQVFTVTAPGDGAITLDGQTIGFLTLELIASIAAAVGVVKLLYFQIDVKAQRAD